MQYKTIFIHCLLLFCHFTNAIAIDCNHARECNCIAITIANVIAIANAIAMAIVMTKQLQFHSRMQVILYFRRPSLNNCDRNRNRECNQNRHCDCNHKYNCNTIAIAMAKYLAIANAIAMRDFTSFHQNTSTRAGRKCVLTGVC